MTLDDKFRNVYFAVFALLAVGNWLILRGLSPERKRRWYPRATLASIAILSPFLVAVPAMSGQFGFALLALAAIALIAYISVAVVRICGSCGHVAQPDNNLFFAAKFCPKCGVPMARAKLFHDSQQ